MAAQVAGARQDPAPSALAASRFANPPDLDPATTTVETLKALEYYQFLPWDRIPPDAKVVFTDSDELPSGVEKANNLYPKGTIILPRRQKQNKAYAVQYHLPWGDETACDHTVSVVSQPGTPNVDLVWVGVVSGEGSWWTKSTSEGMFFYWWEHGITWYLLEACYRPGYGPGAGDGDGSGGSGGGESPNPSPSATSGDFDFAVTINGLPAVDQVVDDVIPEVRVDIDKGSEGFNGADSFAFEFSERADGTSPPMVRSADTMSFDSVRNEITYTVPFREDTLLFPGDQHIKVSVTNKAGLTKTKTVHFAVGARTLYSGIPPISTAYRIQSGTATDVYKPDSVKALEAQGRPSIQYDARTFTRGFYTSPKAPPGNAAAFLVLVGAKAVILLL